MKIVTVSPHRDDAAFSLGLSIGVWLAERHTVEVLDCFTRSEYAPYSDAGSLHPHDRLSYVTALRAKEEVSWTRLYRGPLSVRDLRLKDAPLRFRCSAEEVLGRLPSATDKAVGVIAKALHRAGANALVLPLALGRHVDHVTACESALRATSALRTKTEQAPCAFYEDLPYAARPGGAEAIESAVVDASTLLGEPLRPVYATAAPADPAAAVAHKRKLALCFDSQINDDVAEQIASFCTRYSGRERLWANAAWQRAFPGDGSEAVR